ncbi:hypothetical protein J9303_06005 [Bacillaceae bacterium Marseille-Q3522]|nr:hypothetical protein [Bacillaceae bacterium Marseille-Q3522]
MVKASDHNHALAPEIEQLIETLIIMQGRSNQKINELTAKINQLEHLIHQHPFPKQRVIVLDHRLRKQQ